MNDSTAALSKPMDAAGSLYQQGALDALPILVRQALAGETIFYSDLADELAMPNPRNLNYVLGSVGTSMKHLSEQWGEPVPPIQALVLNRATELPGEGFYEFAADPVSYRSASLKVKRQLTKALLTNVFTYSRWLDVLAHFGLVAPPAPDLSQLLPQSARKRRGNGESPAHLELKTRIADQPSLVELPGKPVMTTIEYAFPSGDTVDVLFELRDEAWAVEVKSHISDDQDLLRGIFQCVKYRALLEAEDAVQRRDRSVRVLLATGTVLPASLRAIALSLGVPTCVVPSSADVLADTHPTNS